MQIDNPSTPCNTLQSCNEYDRMSMYLTHGKGGHNVRYGIVLDSRGGKPGTPSVKGNGDPLDKAEAITGSQGRGVYRIHANDYEVFKVTRRTTPEQER